ncbi:hypothetical protein [Actinoplanes teichomyceticus]|uniref:Lipoprotein n=1 Tax=Actinoplanes teichomyceticus TaxID=1867 RepID=A0A561VGE7_ACTTI|nr:hypothetical protein [Actinoplanes teichomyceticus]TWG10677.1 hypothetical protein FHX34_107171 [Actinoplanes teichomyceticus]GIF15446.1 hypothetical protein Ate01nite_54780 [Actinoplanes teichomyceticus]
MIIRRSTAALCVLFTLAACDDATPATDTPAKPDLALAAVGLTSGDYRYTVTLPGQKIEGVYDHDQPAWSHRSTIDSIVYEFVLVGTDEYTRTDGGAWKHLDLAAEPYAERSARLGLTFDNPDRTGATALLTAARDVTLTGTTLTGQIDTSAMKTAPGELLPVAADLTGGDRLPFTATLDAQGRLTGLTMKMARGAWTLTITGYDPLPAPTVPAKITEG